MLQEGELERVGDTRTRRVDVRLAATTNEDLVTAVAQGKFREDLFFRLNIFPIGIPPLRERRDDVPILADYFLRRYSQLHQRNVTGFSEDAVDALLAYAWPGNVRELENVIERGTLLTSVGGAIELVHLPAAVTAARNAPFGIARSPDLARPADPAAVFPPSSDMADRLDPIQGGEYRLLGTPSKSGAATSPPLRDLGITRAKIGVVRRSWASATCADRGRESRQSISAVLWRRMNEGGP